MLHTMLVTVVIIWSAMPTESVLILVYGMEKYQSANVSEVNCDISKSWLFYCFAVIKCTAPVAPKYGFVKVSHYLLDGVATYTCKYGYKLIGDGTRKCYYDKTWTGVAPICKRKITPCWYLHKMIYSIVPTQQSTVPHWPIQYMVLSRSMALSQEIQHTMLATVVTTW